MPLNQILNRFINNSANSNDIAALRQALTDGRLNLVTAAGQRSIAIGGNVEGSTFHTGDVIQLSEEALRLLLPEEYQPPSPPRALPPRGNLPPGSSLPHQPNAVFTGREETLQSLWQNLRPNGESQRVAITQAAAATGIGGIGKTQTAIEFAFRCGRFFHGVHWLRADQDLKAEIALAGGGMNLSPWPVELDAQVGLTLDAWAKSPGPHLLILDNVPEGEAGPRVLDAWLPRLRGSRILVTTRRERWPAGMGLELCPLDTLPRRESLSLLRKLAPRLNEIPHDEIDPLAERLGDLPLALDLAGRYLSERPHLSIGGYLEELDAAHNTLAHSSLRDWAEYSPTKHATSLAETYLTTWEKVKDPHARRLFCILGYCAPQTLVPREILLRCNALLIESSAESEDEKCVAPPDAELDNALRALTRWGLIKLESVNASFAGAPSLHPLMAEFAQIQDMAGEESALPDLADILGTLSRQAGETGLPSIFAPLRPHIRSAAQTAQKAGLEDAGLLWNNLGYHLEMIADYAGAREAYERALEIDTAAFGPDHPKVAILVNNLGLVLHALGDLAGAREAYERALEIDTAAFGPDHPNVARDTNNLGLVLKDLGDLAGAREAYERALEIDTAAFGPDHPNVARDTNNLGLVLKALGDLAGAREAYERALEIDTAAFGPDHPNVARDTNNLGSVLKALGDLAGAREAFERALEINTAAFGPDHPKVATDVNNLGDVLRALGDLAGAREAFERVLDILDKTLPANHPYVASTTNNLGGVLQDLGDLEGAREALERALEIDTSAFGPDHPKVATDINNLGGVLKNLGDLAGAREAFERALEIFKVHLGEEHPNIATLHNNLGGVLKDLGDLAGAQKAYERALEIWTNTLPAGHPNIEIARRHLEIVIRELGD